MKKPVPIPKNLWKVMKITFSQLLLFILCCSLSMAHSIRAQEVEYFLRPNAMGHGKATTENK